MTPWVLAVGMAVLLLGLLAVVALDDLALADRVRRLEQQVTTLSGQLSKLTGTVNNTHARLLDGLWLRAQAEVDKQIDEARARFHQ